MLTCKNATKLMSQEKERPLSYKEQIALRFHLMMCSGCNNYNKQMELIRKASQHFSGNDKQN